MLRAAHSLTQVQRRVLVLVLTSAVVYVLACVGCASCQRRFIYFPPVFTPAQVKEFTEAGKLEPWQTPDGKLIGWKRLCFKQSVAGQVLILHGNAGCAFQCNHYAEVIQKAAAMDVFMVEYPGYAGRAGSPSERTLEESAEEALNVLGTNCPIYVVGESL